MTTQRLLGSTLIAFLILSPSVSAQQVSRIAARSVDAVDANDTDALLPARSAQSTPSTRMRIANLGNLTVQNGDNSTESVRSIVINSFQEQEEFASSMNKADLINAGAVIALPEVDDEVLVFDDAYVIRRSTTIIVNDPAAAARASTLYRDFLGATEKPQRAAASIATSEALDPEEQAGLRDFMITGIRNLHPNDPLRAAAAKGEQALIDAIAAGQGQLTVEDTLIIPRVAGVNLGNKLAIPTIRQGVFDLKNPQAVKNVTLLGMAVPPKPRPTPQFVPMKVTPIPKAPDRAPSEPKAVSSGKHQLTAEFLMGATRAGNFQWERKWTYPSGYFRLTLGAGYAFGYRIPMEATATVEPTNGYIADYSDKKVIIGTVGSIRTVNGNANFYRRAGLPNNLVQGGDELLLEANVGWGYKFRALWKTIAHRPYTAIGLSFSQSFEPPAYSGSGDKEFALMLDATKTKISAEGKYFGGSATIRFDGAAIGDATIDLETLVDNKPQQTFTLKANKSYQDGAYPYKMTLNPLPLRSGTVVQTRPFGVRLANPAYTGRLVILPSLRLGFKVGYKKLKREFKTGWIPLAGLQLDTGNFAWPVHEGTRSDASWNEGEKTFRLLKKPADIKRLTVKPAN